MREILFVTIGWNAGSNGHHNVLAILFYDWNLNIHREVWRQGIDMARALYFANRYLWLLRMLADLMLAGPVEDQVRSHLSAPQLVTAETYSYILYRCQLHGVSLQLEKFSHEYDRSS